MAPEIDFGDMCTKVSGDVGVKRTYGKPVSEITLCLEKQNAWEKLEELEGKEIFGISGDDSGIIMERGTGKVCRSGQTLSPLRRQRFILKGLEQTLGKETIG